MKKLKLDLDDLEVSTFAAQEEIGAVHARQSPSYEVRCESKVDTDCVCTEVEGCGDSLYCTGSATCWEGCVMTSPGNC